MKLAPLSFLISFIPALAMGQHYVTKEECTDIDITEKNPILKEHFAKKRDQQNSFLCFAYTGADLLTAELGISVSTAQVAAAHNKAIFEKYKDNKNKLDVYLKTNKGVFSSSNENSEMLKGGWTSDALEAVKSEKKICKDTELPTDLNGAIQFDNFVFDLDNLRGQQQSGELTIEQACAKIPQIFNSYAAFEDGVLPEIAWSLFTKDLNSYVSNVVRSKCRIRYNDLGDFKVKTVANPKSSIGNSKGEMFELLDKERVDLYFNSIGDNLKKGKPLSLSYIYSTVAEGRNVNQGAHASTIIARKWGNGRCHYKIKNSLGKGCRGYKKNIECIPEEGSFWMSDKEIYDGSINLTYID